MSEINELSVTAGGRAARSTLRYRDDDRGRDSADRAARMLNHMRERFSIRSAPFMVIKTAASD